jgi:magnesium-transporting ATPase (P-type)
VSYDPSATWSLPAEELLRMLDVAEDGLDENEAQKRLKQYGANLLKPRKKSYSLLLLLAQFNSPIILLLVFAASLSLYLHQVTGASIILVIVFISGLLSSLFDFLTFGALLFLLHANVDQFRTGWFIESVVSASFVVLIIRTRRPFFSSRPSISLMVVTILVGIFTFVLPFSPLSEPFGFTKISAYSLAVVAVIVGIYIAAAELVKKIFYRMQMP